MPRRGVFRKGWYRRHRRPAGPGLQYFTGAAALTVGPATLSGSAAFTAPVYTGASAVTVGAATLSAAATFVAPTYSGAAAFSVGPAALAASATFQAVSQVYRRRKSARKQWRLFDAGTDRWWRVRLAKRRRRQVVSGSSTQAFIGSGAWTVGPATVSGTATFTAPTYSGTSDLTVGAAQMSGSATGPPPPPPAAGRSVVFGLFRRKKKRKDEPAVVPSNPLDPRGRPEWDDDEVLMAAEVARRYWNGGGF